MRKELLPRLATIAILALMTVNLTGCGSESPQELVASAKKRLSLVDGYVNADTLSLLSGRNASVHVEILTKDAPPKLIVAAQAFMKQFGSLGIRTSHAFHDRFLLLDDADVYHFGASIKDLGHRGFMFSRVEEPDVIAAILAKYEKEWKGAVAII